MILSELHPNDYRQLKRTVQHDARVSVHHQNGYLSLKAFLPPREKRGLVLIDPPYEQPDEFNRIASALPVALKRWDTGLYALWYPIKERTIIDRFHKYIKENSHVPKLIIELTLYPDDSPANYLKGCGM